MIMELLDKWGEKNSLTDEHAAYIKSLVEMAGSIDVKRDVFGSDMHQYQFNPVISL
jgi:hypothetical protein